MLSSLSSPRGSSLKVTEISQTHTHTHTHSHSYGSVCQLTSPNYLSPSKFRQISERVCEGGEAELRPVAPPGTPLPPLRSDTLMLC